MTQFYFRLRPFASLFIIFASHTISLAAATAEEASSLNEKKTIASIYIAQSFINQQIKKHLGQSDLLKSLRLDLDTANNSLFAKGIFQIPFEDYETLGLDPKMAQFNFQLSIKPSINSEGYLVLEFPFNETFFYQRYSKNKLRDRVVVPVQLISLGIASTRNYLAALSGDFSVFDKKEKKLQALYRAAENALKAEDNQDAKEILTAKKKSLELDLAASKLKREQFERTNQSLSNIMGLVGQNEFNLNNKVKALNNTIFLKLKINSLVPYLKGIELGGIRLQHKDQDGRGEHYFALDVHSSLVSTQAKMSPDLLLPERRLEVPPSLLIRLNQELFLSQSVVTSKKSKLGDKIKDFKLSFEEDGLHATGSFKKWFVSVPFDALIDFVSTEPDVFEVRIRRLTALGLNIKFLTKFALGAVKARLNKMLEGVCTFEYVGAKDEAKSLKITVHTEKLIPAFPNLHLMDIDVSKGAFLLRIGRKKDEQY